MRLRRRPRPHPIARTASRVARSKLLRPGQVGPGLLVFAVAVNDDSGNHWSFGRVWFLPNQHVDEAFQTLDRVSVLHDSLQLQAVEVFDLSKDGAMAVKQEVLEDDDAGPVTEFRSEG